MMNTFQESSIRYQYTVLPDGKIEGIYRFSLDSHGAICIDYAPCYVDTRPDSVPVLFWKRQKKLPRSLILFSYEDVEHLPEFIEKGLVFQIEGRLITVPIQSGPVGSMFRPALAQEIQLDDCAGQDLTPLKNQIKKEIAQWPQTFTMQLPSESQYHLLYQAIQQEKLKKSQAQKELFEELHRHYHDFSFEKVCEYLRKTDPEVEYFFSHQLSPQQVEEFYFFMKENWPYLNQLSDQENMVLRRCIENDQIDYFQQEYLKRKKFFLNEQANHLDRDPDHSVEMVHRYYHLQHIAADLGFLRSCNINVKPFIAKFTKNINLLLSQDDVVYSGKLDRVPFAIQLCDWILDPLQYREQFDRLNSERRYHPIPLYQMVNDLCALLEKTLLLDQHSVLFEKCLLVMCTLQDQAQHDRFLQYEFIRMIDLMNASKSPFPLHQIKNPHMKEMIIQIISRQDLESFGLPHRERLTKSLLLHPQDWEEIQHHSNFTETQKCEFLCILFENMLQDQNVNRSEIAALLKKYQSIMHHANDSQKINLLSQSKEMRKLFYHSFYPNLSPREIHFEIFCYDALFDPECDHISDRQEFLDMIDDMKELRARISGASFTIESFGQREQVSFKKLEEFALQCSMRPHLRPDLSQLQDGANNQRIFSWVALTDNAADVYQKWVHSVHDFKTIFAQGYRVISQDLQETDTSIDHSHPDRLEILRKQASHTIYKDLEKCFIPALQYEYEKDRQFFEKSSLNDHPIDIFIKEFLENQDTIVYDLHSILNRDFLIAFIHALYPQLSKKQALLSTVYFDLGRFSKQYRCDVQTIEMLIDQDFDEHDLAQVQSIAKVSSILTTEDIKSCTGSHISHLLDFQKTEHCPLIQKLCQKVLEDQAYTMREMLAILDVWLSRDLSQDDFKFLSEVFLENSRYLGKISLLIEACDDASRRKLKPKYHELCAKLWECFLKKDPITLEEEISVKAFFFGSGLKNSRELNLETMAENDRKKILEWIVKSHCSRLVGKHVPGHCELIEYYFAQMGYLPAHHPDQDRFIQLAITSIEYDRFDSAIDSIHPKLRAVQLVDSEKAPLSHVEFSKKIISEINADHLGTLIDQMAILQSQPEVWNHLVHHVIDSKKIHILFEKWGQFDEKKRIATWMILSEKAPEQVKAILNADHSLEPHAYSPQFQSELIQLAMMLMPNDRASPFGEFVDLELARSVSPHISGGPLRVKLCKQIISEINADHLGTLIDQMAILQSQPAVWNHLVHHVIDSKKIHILFEKWGQFDEKNKKAIWTALIFKAPAQLQEILSSPDFFECRENIRAQLTLDEQKTIVQELVSQDTNVAIMENLYRLFKKEGMIHPEIFSDQSWLRTLRGRSHFFQAVGDCGSLKKAFLDSLKDITDKNQDPAGLFEAMRGFLYLSDHKEIGVALLRSILSTYSSIDEIRDHRAIVLIGFIGKNLQFFSDSLTLDEYDHILKWSFSHRAPRFYQYHRDSIEKILESVKLHFSVFCEMHTQVPVEVKNSVAFSIQNFQRKIREDLNIRGSGELFCQNIQEAFQKIAALKKNVKLKKDTLDLVIQQTHARWDRVNQNYFQSHLIEAGVQSSSSHSIDCRSILEGFQNDSSQMTSTDLVILAREITRHYVDDRHFANLFENSFSVQKHVSKISQSLSAQMNQYSCYLTSISSYDSSKELNDRMPAVMSSLFPPNTPKEQIITSIRRIQEYFDKHPQNKKILLKEITRELLLAKKFYDDCIYGPRQGLKRESLIQRIDSLFLHDLKSIADYAWDLSFFKSEELIHQIQDECINLMEKRKKMLPHRPLLEEIYFPTFRLTKSGEIKNYEGWMDVTYGKIRWMLQSLVRLLIRMNLHDSQVHTITKSSVMRFGHDHSVSDPKQPRKP